MSFSIISDKKTHTKKKKDQPIQLNALAVRITFTASTKTWLFFFFAYANVFLHSTNQMVQRRVDREHRGEGGSGGGGAREAEAIHIIRFLFVPNRRIDRGTALWRREAQVILAAILTFYSTPTPSPFCYTPSFCRYASVQFPLGSLPSLRASPTQKSTGFASRLRLDHFFFFPKTQANGWFALNATKSVGASMAFCFD